jgi:hypothetical protein
VDSRSHLEQEGLREVGKLIEFRDGSTAIEMDIRSKWYRYVFRREGERWVKVRLAGQWEIWEAMLQVSLKEWEPWKAQLTSTELDELLVMLLKRETPKRTKLAAGTATLLRKALEEFKDLRGYLGDEQALVRIKNSPPAVRAIAIEVAKLLDIPLWMTDVHDFTNYDRRGDASAAGKGAADQIADDAGVELSRRHDDKSRHTLCVSSLNGTIVLNVALRGVEHCPSVFFARYEYTESPHVYRALQVLAEAIRRDNDERPQE